MHLFVKFILNIVKFALLFALVSIVANCVLGVSTDGNASQSQVGSSASSVSSVLDGFGIDIKNGKQMNIGKAIPKAEKNFSDINNMKVHLFK